MVLSNVIVDVTIPRRSFVFGQSRAKASAGFTDVRSLAVAAFDLVYCPDLHINLIPAFSHKRDWHSRANTHVNILKCSFRADHKPIPFKFIHQFLNVFVIFLFIFLGCKSKHFPANLLSLSTSQNNLTSLKVLLWRKPVHSTNIFNTFHPRTSNFQI